MLATALPATALSASSQAPCAAAPTPAAPAGPAAGDGPDSFARLLGAADNAQRAADDEAPDDTPPTAPAAGTAGKRGTTAQRSCTRPCDSPGGKGPVTGTPRHDEQPQDIPAATDALAPGQAVDNAVGVDAAALLASLAALARPPATPTPAASDAAGRNAPAQGLEGSRSASDLSGGAGIADARSNTNGLPALAGTAPGTAPGAARTATADTSGAAPSVTPFATLLASSAAAQAARGAAGETTRLAAEVQAARSEGLNNAATPLPLPALATPAGPTPGAAASAPAEARLSASPGSPEFAHQLGAQLTTFVREGVQHARLELHPVELGPVTVQIQLEGGNAQLSFAAEHAQTRQALEQALPELAANLRESGLTLSGGGVFEQPHQPRQGDGQAAAGDRPSGTSVQGGSDGAPGAMLPATPPRRRGVVDLVA